MMPTQRRTSKPVSILDLQVAFADHLDGLLAARAGGSRLVQDAVYALRNASGCLGEAAEAIATSDSMDDPRIAEPFRIAIATMLEACSKVPASLMPGGRSLVLAAVEEESRSGKRRGERLHSR